MNLYLSVLQLFLWPLEETSDVEVDGETLDEALNRINANINSLIQLTNFSYGKISLSHMGLFKKKKRLSSCHIVISCSSKSDNFFCFFAKPILQGSTRGVNRI